MVTHYCNHSYSRGGGRKTESLRAAQAKLGRPYLKKQNAKQKVWGRGSSDRILTWQAQGTEFNSQYCKKEKVVFIPFKLKSTLQI
jgi:hypothetical protein